MKTGKMNTSRRESNFVCRMNPEDREHYLKRFMASCNPEQLIPFIEITKHDKYFRGIEYVINVPDVKRIEEESDQIILEKTDKILKLENEIENLKQYKKVLMENSVHRTEYIKELEKELVEAYKSRKHGHMFWGGELEGINNRIKELEGE